MSVEKYSIQDLKELTNRLSRDDIKKLLNALSVPEGVCAFECEAIDFLRAMKKWTQFDSFRFYQSLNSVRPDLVPIAVRIPWLCTDRPVTRSTEELTVKSLIETLKNGIGIGNLKLINMYHSSEESGEDVRFESTMKMIFEKNLIKKDLTRLSKILIDLELNDLAGKLDAYKRIFETMEEYEFTSKFKNELTRIGNQIVEWENLVKIHLETQFRDVKQMLGSDKAVSLEKVYVDLTILKQKPRRVKLEDETTYNEIAYLRKIANKEVEVTPINFTEELKSCDPSKPQIWCFIGNPGCGKTFLCNRTALRFGNNEVSAFSYSLCIPCRNQEWHEMESSRVDKGFPITSEFICKWLCLGLPVGPSWTTQLAKHITETDGEGLLLIIDSLDEFTKSVPFNKTLLFLLLTRQTLTRSFILLTSRPGAWTDVSTSHHLHISTFFHVLGFSPEQRDLYFEKQFEDTSLFDRCTRLLDRYDEMKQLSLIPVNASLFAALLKSEDGAHIHTLTQLYYELILYLIRRQLDRMGFEELTKVNEICELDSGVVECLHEIGYIAYQGVAMREMISDKKVPLQIGSVKMASHCLGLVHEYVREEKMGHFTKVWSFAHLTIQEFIGAIWLRSTKWHDQCLSVRFIVHTNDVFSQFRMVVRFLCGLLSDQSMNVFYLLCKHVTPHPVPISQLPECFQLRFENEFFKYTDWNEFTERFLQLNAMLRESNSESIPKYFNACRRFLPRSFSLYIESAVTPNEWICFLESLPLLDHIHLICVDSRYVTPEQLFHLLESVEQCSVDCVALKLSRKYNTEVLPYANAIQRTQLSNTKLSLDLHYSKLTETETVKALFSSSTNQILSGLRLYENGFPPDTYSLLTNQISTCQNIVYSHSNTSESEVLFSALSSATHINGLHLLKIPTEYHQQLFSLLPTLSNLREITWEDDYSILPHITHLSTLSFLRITGFLRIGYGQYTRVNLSDSLLQLLHSNRHSIRVLGLWYLEKIGFSSFDGFLRCLQFCTNLVQLELQYARISCDDVTFWCSTLHSLTSLLYLEFSNVSLSDSGMLSLCRGLLFHPTIKHLFVCDCKLSSDSCLPLRNLIPTLKQLKYLTMTGLSKPKTKPVKLLELTADQYAIEHDLD